MYSQVCNLSFLLLISCFGAATLTSALPFCKTKPYIFTETAWFQKFQLPGAQLGPWRIFKCSGGENTELPGCLSAAQNHKAHSDHQTLPVSVEEVWLPVNTFTAMAASDIPVMSAFNSMVFPFYLDIFAVTVTCNPCSSSKDEMWVVKAQQSDVEIHGTAF